MDGFWCELPLCCPFFFSFLCLLISSLLRLPTDALSVTDSASEPHLSWISLQQWAQEAWRKKYQVTPQALICSRLLFFQFSMSLFHRYLILLLVL